MGTDIAALAGVVREALERSTSAGAPLAPTPKSLVAEAASGISEAARAERLRVLIYSTDIGGGHDAMANAIKGELLLRHGADGVDVQVANGLRIGNPVMHTLMRDGYAAQLKYAPGSYGAMYELATTSVVGRINDSLNRALTAPRLAADIARRQPDVVVSTHPNITGTLGHLRRDGQLRVPALATIIDSDPHRLWVSGGVDEHLVLNPEDIPRIARFGSDAEPVTGRLVRPPVDRRSFEHYDVAAAREQFGLPQDRRVLLVSGGSWGLALPDAELHRILSETDLHLAVATGRNEQALQHLRSTFPADRVTGIPFTREMPKLLAASDGMLTNSAGMTTLEGFARGRPVVLYRPLPGHGVDGAAALHADQLATHATTPEAAVDALRRIERGDDPDLAARMVRARALFDRGEPVADVVTDFAKAGRRMREPVAR